MKKKHLADIVTAVNLLLILVLFSVPFWGFWENKFHFFAWKISLWTILYFLLLFVIIGFLVYILNKTVAFRKMEKFLWFYQEIPEHLSEVVVVTQSAKESLVIYINQAAEDFYGVNRDDIISVENFDQLTARKEGLQYRRYPLKSEKRHIFDINIAKV